MRTVRLATVLALFPALVAAQNPIDLSKYLDERSAEVAMARSAAPARISDSATVLYLTRGGYVEAAKGTNGFTCLVVREYEASLTDIKSWQQVQNRAPHCMNPAASRTILQEMRYRAELVLAGNSIDTVRARVTAAFASGRLKPAEPGAMAYMMSKHQKLANTPSEWVPHVMFYYPPGFDPQVGYGGWTDPVIQTGFDPIMGSLVLVPVPAWSDGSAHH